VDEDEFLRNIELLKKKSASPRIGIRKGRGTKSLAASPVIGSDDSKKKTKEGRKWDGKISAKDAKSLDYSNSDATDVVNADHLVSLHACFYSMYI
jgi:signal recognition particle receptor subunit alpha